MLTVFLQSKKWKRGGLVTKPKDPYKQGYTFIGWYSNGIEYDWNTPITDNITIYANFEGIPLTITYLTDGNGVIWGDNPQTVLYGENGEEVEAIPNIGYVFVKWSDGVTNPTRFERDVIKDITVTAIFEEVETKTYQVNIYYPHRDTLYETLYVKEGQPVPLPNIPTKNGVLVWYNIKRDDNDDNLNGDWGTHPSPPIATKDLELYCIIYFSLDLELLDGTWIGALGIPDGDDVVKSLCDDGLPDEYKKTIGYKYKDTNEEVIFPFIMTKDITLIPIYYEPKPFVLGKSILGSGDYYI